MSRFYLALSCLVLWSCGTEAFGAAKPTKPAALRYETDVFPLLKTYCFDCHGDGVKKGDLSLDGFTTRASVHADRKTWEHVLQNLRSSQMPPAKKKSQPTPEEREKMVQWIENDLFPVDCDNPDPGRVTIRRLNRVEYNNTVRDLVGVEFQPARDFPQDDVGYGFDNIGDVLSMPPVLLEKYLAASVQIFDEAIVTEEWTQPLKRRLEFDDLEATAATDPRDRGWFALVKEGDVHARLNFRADGDYILRVMAAGEQAGPEVVKMGLTLDGRSLATQLVPQAPNEGKVHEIRFTTTRGSHTVGVQYLNNYYNPKEADAKHRDRNLLVQYVEVEGPFGAVTAALPETHRRIFIKTPDPRRPEIAAREILQSFARKAWRRPVDKTEVTRLLSLFSMANGRGDSFEKSVRIALQAILVSPNFLFRGELQPEPDNPQRVHPVSEFSLASRLSYFLWSSMPDEELFKLAEAGRLRKNLSTQVTRMLKDPKSQALVDNFGGQWLQIRNLDVVNPDRTLFPAFNDRLRRDFNQETSLFLRAMMLEDRSLLELLDANYSYLNERLAKLYGVEGVHGEEFRKVIFQDPNRGGILTHGSILTITSNPTRTSPVKRGKWVMENLLGTPPPPPPPNVPELKVDKDHPLVGTLRQRMEQHRQNPACASCHERMDAIGFGFENFDAIGAWRSKEGGAQIDPSGTLGSGSSFQGPAELKRLLMEKRRKEFLRCVTEKMLTYALGRGVEYYDRCAVDRVLQELEKSDYRFSSLVHGIVNSPPFQKRRGEGTSPLQAAR